MMKFVHTVVWVAMVSLLASSAFADAGDAGMSDMGQADSGMSDMGSMGPIDLGVEDSGLPDDAGSSDAGLADTGIADTGSADTGSADTGAPPRPDRFTVSGSAVLSTSEAATVEVVLVPADGTPLTDFTDAAGRFEFRDQPAGTYDLTVSYPGFVAQSRTIELMADRRVDIVLFPDVTFTVLIDVTFVDAAGPVNATARSLGREVIVDGEGPGEIELSLGAGPWEVDVTSPGFVAANLAFNLAPDRDQSEPVKLFVVLERPTAPEITTDAGCSCSQGPSAPDGSALILLAAVGLLAIRRRIR